MSDSWTIFQTKSFEKKAEETVVGNANSEDEAKTLCKTFAKKTLLGDTIAEINGEWCVQGWDKETNMFTYVRYRRDTKAE